MSEGGHIELERSVESIAVGVRHRNDLGDLAPLIGSIERLGLLQPITIAPDGTLLCGRRRLEAIRQLKWQTVKVWVRSGLSDDLNNLLAQQDENLLHKPFSVIEAAALYRELKTVLAEDAARRQQATRFGAVATEASDGGAESAPPSRPGKTRNQAAELVTGSAAYNRLEQVSEIEDIVADEDQPGPIRDLAQNALGNIASGAAVNPWFKEISTIKHSAASHSGEVDELHRLASEALERVRQPAKNRPKPTPLRRKRSTRSFVHTWTDMDGWSARYDPAEIGAALTADEWALFERVLEETTTFHHHARTARSGRGAGAAV